MTGTETDTGHKPGTAPYVGYPSYTNMIGGFKSIILPDRIDRSVLRGFSGIVGTQLLSALRFFAQINGAGQPTEHLKRLVDAHGTEGWAAEVEGQLRRAYAPLFEINLASASPSQFSEKFKASYPAEGDTLRKAMTFFLNATRDAKINVSPLIMKGKKPRSGPTQRKPKTPKPASAAKSDMGQGGTGKPADNNNSGDGADSFAKELLSKFPPFDPTWSDEIKAKWFAGFDQFMAMTKK